MRQKPEEDAEARNRRRATRPNLPPPLRQVIKCNCIVSHRITSHRRRVASHRIASHRMPCYVIVPPLLRRLPHGSGAENRSRVGTSGLRALVCGLRRARDSTRLRAIQFAARPPVALSTGCSSAGSQSVSPSVRPWSSLPSRKLSHAPYPPQAGRGNLPVICCQLLALLTPWALWLPLPVAPCTNLSFRLSDDAALPVRLPFAARVSPSRCCASPSSPMRPQTPSPSVARSPVAGSPQLDALPRLVSPSPSPPLST